MKICNKTGCGVCTNCDGTPPSTNGISHGDICRKKVQIIIDFLSDGGYYRFDGKNLYTLHTAVLGDNGQIAYDVKK